MGAVQEMRKVYTLQTQLVKHIQIPRELSGRGPCFCSIKMTKPYKVLFIRNECEIKQFN